MTIASNEGTQTSSAREVPYVSIVRHSDALDKAHALHNDVPQAKGYRGLAIWLSSAVVGGFACGFAAFLLLGIPHQTVSPPVRASNQALIEATNRAESAGITQTVVPVLYDRATVNQKPGEMLSASSNTRSTAILEEVRTRNRRLEALVKVLRRRDASDRRESSVTHRN